VAAAAILVVAAMATRVPDVAAQSPGTAGAPDAASLYIQNCASCHGAGGEGTAAGPSLVGVGAASADFFLRTGRMPLGAPNQRPVEQLPRFDDRQIEALVDYIAMFGPGPPIPQVGTTGDVQRGWAIYNANCAACHAATGAGNAVGGGQAAVGLGRATDEVIAEAVTIGPGVMPRFDFSEPDRDALIGYIRYLRTERPPGGAPIGGVGPVAEGFVAVVVGLTAVFLIVRFVGRRSHEGEPEIAPDVPPSGVDVT
jgi:ubiquinol-cytochrome c reductase cytochrome c subunit